MSKAATNRRWCSTPVYRTNYEVIFGNRQSEKHLPCEDRPDLSDTEHCVDDLVCGHCVGPCLTGGHHPGRDGDGRKSGGDSGGQAPGC